MSLLNILLIIHGRSPLKTLTERAWTGLASSRQIQLDVRITEHRGHAEEIAARAAGYDLLIACGGDGTNHEVINGLMRVEMEQRPVFAPIAGGSGNDFARIRTALSSSEILTRFEQGTITEIPLIELNWGKERRLALNVSTAGIGAEIAQLVNRRKFKLPPAFNYYSAILYWLARYRAPEIILTANGKQMKTRTQPFLLAVGNGQFAGNGLGLCPQASLESPELALTVIGDVGVLDFLRYQQTLQRCQKVKDPRVDYHTAREVSIEVKRGPFSLEADGEFLCTLHAGDRITYAKTEQTLRLI